MEERKKKFKDFEFKLFGTRWKVEFKGYVCPEKGDPDLFYYGHTDSVHNVITINTLDMNNKPLLDRTILLTLYHELMHSILGSGCYENCNNDEPLVEWCAKCICSLLEQGVLDYGRDKK